MKDTYASLEFRDGNPLPYLLGTRIPAATIYIHYNSWGYKSIEELARDRDLDIGAVREAIDWCSVNHDLITSECAKERKKTGFE